MSNVKVMLQTVDDTAKGVQSASGNLKKFEKAASGSAVGVQQIGSNLTDTQKKMASFSSIMSQKYAKEIKAMNEPQQSLIQKLGVMKEEMIAVAAVAATAGAAVKMAWDFGVEGAGILRMKEASSDLAQSMGGNMDEIVNALNRASLGTVSNTELMTSASRAMMLGLGTDSEKLASLMEVAALRGRAMGLSTSQAFSDIVTGIGRMSPLILDNLGIVIDAEKRYSEYAETMGISASEIDSATKKQILLNGVLEEGQTQLDAVGGLTADAAAEIERMGAAFKNTADNIKTKFTPAVAAVAKATADWLYLQADLTSATADGVVTQKEAADIMANVKTGWVNAADAAAELQMKVTESNISLYDQNERAGDTERAMRAYALATEEAANEQAYLKTELSELQTIVAGGFGKEITNFTEKVTDLEEKSTDLKDQIAALETKQYLTAAQKEELSALRGELGETEESLARLEEQHTLTMRKMAFNLIVQKAASDGLTENEVANAALIAESWGLLDESTAAALGAINKIDLENTSVLDLYSDLENLKEIMGETASTSQTEFDNMQGGIDTLHNEKLSEMFGTLEGIDATAPKAKESVNSAVSSINTSDNRLDTSNLSAASGYLDSIASKPRNMVFTITTIVSTIRGYGSGGGGVQGAGGATGMEHFTVPQGYPNDGYLLPVSTGEIVTVKSPGQSAMMMKSASTSGGGGKMVNIEKIEIYEAANGRQILDEINRELALQGVA